MATAQKPAAEVQTGRKYWPPMLAIGIAFLLVLAVGAFFIFGMDPLDSRVGAAMPDTGQTPPAPAATAPVGY